MSTLLAKMTLPIVLIIGTTMVPAFAAPTPPQPGSPQPSLPGSLPGIETVPQAGGSDLNGRSNKPLRTTRRRTAARRSHRQVRTRFHEPIERPALANVELLAPLPHPPQPPHFTVPTPAYPLENFVTAYTTPPPPVVCHRVRRDPDLPDPRLLYEKTVVCEADNP